MPCLLAESCDRGEVSEDSLRPDDAAAHVAIVTGANHGIGAATSLALAGAGCAVLCAYWRVEDPSDAAVPEAYRRYRAADAGHVVFAIRDAGGRAVSAEADLRDPATPARLFDTAEAHLGPVDVLINNATGWVQDSFLPASRDRHGRVLQAVSAATHATQFAVDAMAPALLIAEFARRHIQRGARWGRIIGLTSGGELGFPEEVSYGAAKAAQTNYTMSAAFELADVGIQEALLEERLDLAAYPEALRAWAVAEARCELFRRWQSPRPDRRGRSPILELERRLVQAARDPVIDVRLEQTGQPRR